MKISRLNAIESNFTGWEIGSSTEREQQLIEHVSKVCKIIVVSVAEAE